MEIYETDTRMVLIWEGTGWGPIWDQPWGFVARAIGSAQSGIGTTTTDLTGTTISPVVTPGRMYRISAFVRCSTTTASHRFVIIIRNNSGSTVRRVFDGGHDTLGGGNITMVSNSFVISASELSGVTSLNLAAAMISGTGTLTTSASGNEYGPEIAMEDIGPDTTMVGSLLYPSNTNATNYQICTSSTRPSSPFAGLQIYETDTKKNLIYDTTLGWLPPWNTAWGQIGYAELASNQTLTGAGPHDITGCSVAHTYVAGRRIQVTTDVSFVSPTVLNDQWAALVQDGGSSTLARTVRWRGTITNDALAAEGSYNFTSTAGALTVKLAVQRLSGSGNIDIGGGSGNQTFILVTDIGPA